MGTVPRIGQARKIKRRQDWDAERVRQFIKCVLETEDEDTREIRAGVLVWSVWLVGTNLQRLREFTGIPMSDVNRVSRHLRGAGIWRGNSWRYDWADDSCTDGEMTIGLVMTILVGTGDILHRNGKYKARTYGDMVEWAVGTDLERLPWKLSKMPAYGRRSWTIPGYAPLERVA